MALIRSVVLSLLACSIWINPAKVSAQVNCDEQKPETTQIRCFLDAAKAAKQPEICNSAQSSIVQFHCLSNYAEKSGDTAVCALINFEDSEIEALRDACISGVAIAKRDPKVCAEAKSSGLRDACYLMLVLDHGADKAICENIENEALRSGCSY